MGGGVCDFDAGVDGAGVPDLGAAVSAGVVGGSAVEVLGIRMSLAIGHPYRAKNLPRRCLVEHVSCVPTSGICCERGIIS